MSTRSTPAKPVLIMKDTGYTIIQVRAELFARSNAAVFRGRAAAVSLCAFTDALLVLQLLLTIACGVTFGFALHKADVYRVSTIRDQFRFHTWTMLKVWKTPNVPIKSIPAILT